MCSVCMSMRDRYAHPCGRTKTCQDGFLQLFFHIINELICYFETRSLTESEVCYADWPVICEYPPISSSKLLSCRPAPYIYAWLLHGCWESGFRPHVCVVSTLPTEPSPGSIRMAFTFQVQFFLGCWKCCPSVFSSVHKYNIPVMLCLLWG